jgi:thioesterase domain-containing protein/acyl carrier protein
VSELRSVDMLADVLKSSTLPLNSDLPGDFDPPQGELEEKLAAAWAEALGRQHVGRHDDFFELGGDSIAAVQLMIALQEVVPGEMLPLRAILEAPTVEQFAAWLQKDQGNEQKILVQIRPGSPARPPFFCVHATDGTAIGMQPLAKGFSDDLPFYCLQGKGLDGTEPWQSVEDAATYCLSEIRKVQPEGPYYLGGFCFGGFVAYEMACMLEQQGERVPVLAIIDGFNPAFLRGKTAFKMFLSLVRFYFRRAAMHARKMTAQGPSGWLSYMGGRLKAVFVHAGRFKDRLNQVKARQNMTVSESEAIDPTQFDEILKRLEPLGRALAAKWTPKPYSGDAIIFRVSQRSDDPYEDYYLGWRRLIRGKLESFEVEATHDDILNEPMVFPCSVKIDAKLREKAAENAVAK